jgi:hypothetical protein
LATSVAKVWLAIVACWCAYWLVAGEDGAQGVDGGVAELGGGGEQVVRVRKPASFGVATARFCSVRSAGSGVAAVDHRCASSRSARRGHDPAGGMTFQIRACSR